MISSRFTTKVSRSLLIPLAILTLAACNKVDESPIQQSAPDTAAVNTSLETMAKTFARAVESPEVRQRIHTLVGERFDGDTNVLYKTLVGGPQAQSGIHQALAAAYNQSELSSQAQGKESLKAVEALANNIPRFQVAVPFLFDKWDAESYVPLVSYVPAGVDDEDMEEYKAFDAQGNVHVLNEHRLPQQPVIFLSQNERTDESGALLPAFAASTAETVSPTLELTPQSHSCSGGRNVYVRHVRLYNDHEPRAKGFPEIKLKVTSNPSRLSYNYGLGEVNQEGATYKVDRFIGCTPNRSTVTFTWYEDDDWPDSDDQYGSTGAYYTRFDGVESRFDVPGLRFWTN